VRGDNVRFSELFILVEKSERKPLTCLTDVSALFIFNKSIIS